MSSFHELWFKLGHNPVYWVLSALVVTHSWASGGSSTNLTKSLNQKYMTTILGRWCIRIPFSVSLTFSHLFLGTFEGNWYTFSPLLLHNYSLEFLHFSFSPKFIPQSVRSLIIQPVILLLSLLLFYSSLTRRLSLSKFFILFFSCSQNTKLYWLQALSLIPPFTPPCSFKNAEVHLQFIVAATFHPLTLYYSFCPVSQSLRLSSL